MSSSKWIEFRPLLSTGKTPRYGVYAKDASWALLGEVKWYGAWRQLCFFPAKETIFERQCLRDIAEFCEVESKKYRDSKKAV